jgi:succinate dehydrogenase/fumarate reductase flavoprotein subunit
MRAAIEAARLGVSVLLVDKGKPGRSSICSGDTGGSFGSIRVPEEMGGDHSVPLSAVLKDAVTAGEYLNREDMAQVFCDEAIDRFNDLVQWGVQFRRRSNGKYSAQRYMGESYPYGFVMACTHNYLFDCMKKEVDSLSVTCLSNVMVTKLLTSDGRVVGAFGLDRSWGGYLVIKATIVAAGGMTGLLKYTSAYHPCSGDSFVLAYDAGAELFNMEISDARQTVNYSSNQS